jgi:hypothetical protein
MQRMRWAELTDDAPTGMIMTGESVDG